MVKCEVWDSGHNTPSPRPVHPAPSHTHTHTFLYTHTSSWVRIKVFRSPDSNHIIIDASMEGRVYQSHQCHPTRSQITTIVFPTRPPHCWYITQLGLSVLLHKNYTRLSSITPQTFITPSNPLENDSFWKLCVTPRKVLCLFSYKLQTGSIEVRCCGCIR